MKHIAALALLAAFAFSAAGQGLAKKAAKRVQRPRSAATELVMGGFSRDRELLSDPYVFVDGTAERLWRFIVHENHAEETGYYAQRLQQGGEFGPLGGGCYLVVHVSIDVACPDTGVLRELVRATDDTLLGEPNATPEGFWILVESGGMTRGIIWSGYHALVLRRTADGRLVPHAVELAHGESGMADDDDARCGEPNGDPPPSEKVSSVVSHVLKDLDGDGVQDVRFELLEKDCRTGRERRLRRSYVWKGGTLVLLRTRHR